MVYSSSGARQLSRSAKKRIQVIREERNNSALNMRENQADRSNFAFVADKWSCCRVLAIVIGFPGCAHR